MKSKKKIVVFILLVLGLICLFTPFRVGVPGHYLKILGLVLVMFTLYMVSSKLTSKNVNENRNENLKL